MTGRIGRFVSWGKRCTDLDNIANKMKKYGWSKQTSDLFRKKANLELDIGVISRILDCSNNFNKTAEEHIQLIEGEIKNADLSDFNVEVFLHKPEIPIHAEPRVIVQFKNIDFNITRFMDDKDIGEEITDKDILGKIVAQISLHQMEYSDGPSAIKLSFVSCNFNSQLLLTVSINSINSPVFSCRTYGNAALEFINCKSRNINFSTVFDSSSFGSVTLEKCSIKEGIAVFQRKFVNQISQQNKFYAPIIMKEPSIEIIDTCIDNLKIIGKIDSFFRKENSFKCLSSSEYDFNLFYWGGYQKISTDDDDVFINRKFFLALNKNDVIQNDAFQLLTIQKELAKCHHAILRPEGKPSWKDRVLFWFSDRLSYHGTCWITTVTWFFILNLFIMIPFDVLVSVEKIEDLNKFFDIYFQLFNPTELASRVYGIDEDNGWASFFDFVHKFFYALLSYELVKTLRRFGRSNSAPPRI